MHVLPKRSGQNVAQRNEKLLSSGKHIRHGLHDANDGAADCILVRLHQGLQILAARDDGEKSQRLDLGQTKIVVH